MKKPTLSTAAASRIRAEAKRIMGKTAVILALLLCGMVAQAKKVPIQVTLGAGATPVINGGSIRCQWITFQNNSARTMNLADATVTTGKGIQLTAGGSFYLAPTYARDFDLAGWYAIGTAGDVLSVVCEDGQ